MLEEENNKTENNLKEENDQTDNDLENDEELDNLSKYKYDRLLIVIPLIPYTIKFSYFVNIKLNFDTLNYCIFGIIPLTPKSYPFY